ncbi:ankyrin repeat-containing protein NPR4-like [Salvia hispanica]|uniref:ankyrin repeat-containing protein NPR4-like n=1 Tax=Salvia hispanica TaxID=49212 RepID=UPI0020096A93|nr:ankyrin repeat-containing protein NPR4-like [Salvia hispanica]
MVPEEAKKILHDSATKGDVATFQTLVQQDPFLVDQVSFARARNLLHIAAASGYVEIVKIVLYVAPDEMRWWVDDQGMNPVHIAAMKGHVQILEELLQHDLSPAMERLHRGQTVLHLCVKHGQLQTLRLLLEKLGDLVRAKDDDGETILHLAVRYNQIEMVRYLVESNKIEKLTDNSMGKTPLDILRESSQHTTTFSETEGLLLRLSDQPFLHVFREITGTTMVVVALIAAMAFQAAVNPPGGVWQDDTSSHMAGKAVMASSHPKLYKLFSRANTTAFVSSLLVILLVAFRTPTNASLFVMLIWYTTLVSMASIGVSYRASSIMTNPIETQTPGQIVAMVVSVFVGIVVLVAVYIYMMLLYSMWKRLKQQHEDVTIADRIFRLFYQFQRIIERVVVN